MGVTVSLHEGGFFDSGSAELRAEAVPVLKAVWRRRCPCGALRVEGHTDNVPMRSAMYASNWELSTARAAAIARFLLEHSAVNPQQVLGCGLCRVSSGGEQCDGRGAGCRIVA